MIAAQTAFLPAAAVGSCRRCGRTLTDPVSVAAGLGPVCAGRCRSRGEPMDATDDRHDLPFDPIAGDVVCRRDAGGIKHFNVAQRHVHHSPTGMEWGYGGSGPADFALNVLARVLPPAVPVPPPPAEDATAEDRDRHEAALAAAGVELADGSRVPDAVWSLHHDFKRAFVARLPEGGGTIRGDAIRAWLRERGALPVD